jgi:hypothetical protein
LLLPVSVSVVSFSSFTGTFDTPWFESNKLKAKTHQTISCDSTMVVAANNNNSAGCCSFH